MNNNKLPKRDILLLAIGEIAVALLVTAGYLVADAFDILNFSYRVITGALLGVAVTVLNYLFLTVSVNRAIDGYLALRGDKEMDEETAAKFASEHSMPIQNAIKTSFIIRTVSMLIALLLAFLTGQFDPIATAIPLLAFRPLLTLSEMLRTKRSAPPNPDNFIKYNDDEKESDE